jgi:fumarylacetoacetase
MLNETHDPGLRSWVAANEAGCDFPIQNLSFAVFRRVAHGERFRGGVAIGDQIVDLGALSACGVLQGLAAEAAAAGAHDKLNPLMAIASAAAPCPARPPVKPAPSSS